MTIAVASTLCGCSLDSLSAGAGRSYRRRGAFLTVAGLLAVMVDSGSAVAAVVVCLLHHLCFAAIAPLLGTS